MKVIGVSAHMRIWAVILFQASLLIWGVIFLPKNLKFSCLNADSGESRQVASARAGSLGTMRLEVASRDKSILKEAVKL